MRLVDDDRPGDNDVHRPWRQVFSFLDCLDWISWTLTLHDLRR